MSSQRFAPEFKEEAVRQIVERGYPVSEVAQRLGAQPLQVGEGGEAERGRSACQRTRRGEERDPQAARPTAPHKRGTRHFTKGRRVLCQGTRVRYAFVNDHAKEHGIATMCRVLDVTRSGFYAWRHKPLSDRAIEALRGYKAPRAIHGRRRSSRRTRCSGSSP